MVYHQNYYNCGDVVLRMHGVLCTQVEDQLVRAFPEITGRCPTIMDGLLNKYSIGTHPDVWESYHWAITQIERVCLGHNF